MTVISFEQGPISIKVEKLDSGGYHVIRHSGNASFSFPFNDLQSALETFDWHVAQFKGKQDARG